MFPLNYPQIPFKMSTLLLAPLLLILLHNSYFYNEMWLLENKMQTLFRNVIFSQQLSTTQLLAHFPPLPCPHGMEERIRRVKLRNLVV